MSGDEENAAELKIGQEFLLQKCLTVSEVALILQNKLEQHEHEPESGNPAAQVSQVFEKTLGYAKRFSRHKSPDTAQQVRETLCRYNIAEFELCVLANLCPDSVDEVKALVPSLVHHTREKFQGIPGTERIDQMLNDLALIKKFD